MAKPDDEGKILMHVDCENGHEDVWQFALTKDELTQAIQEQAAAAQRARDAGSANAPKDPTKAYATITMDVATQQVSIDCFVATPGLGIQLAGILMSHFFAQLQATSRPAGAPGGLKLPPKGIVHPKTGRLVN
jgi:hypothetical protein